MFIKILSRFILQSKQLHRDKSCFPLKQLKRPDKKGEKKVKSKSKISEGFNYLYSNKERFRG